MRNRLHIIPWLLIVAVFLVGFGPFTNTIYRTWTGYSTSANVINVAVSPTAAPTFVVPYNPSRYSYSIYPLSAATPGGSVYACCTYGPNSTATPAAVPTAGSGNTCAVGSYVPVNSPFSEQNAPSLGLWCTSSGGTITYSNVENK